MATQLETWEVWYPAAAANGLLVGKGQLDPTDRLLIHAAPDVITVEIRSKDGGRIAFTKDIKRTQESPMCLLSRDGSIIHRQDVWPGEEHIGLPVMLPGGEVGLLKSWWNAPDHQEWRWQIELYNSLRE